MSELVRRAQAWLGTLVSIEIEADAAGRAAALAASTAAFAAIERVHWSMTPETASSDIARFNAAPRGALVRCDPWTLRVLGLAERLRRDSGGLFDVALGTASAAAYRIADPVCVMKLDSQARLDLGGIAKGFAVDRAIATLRRAGVRRGLVNAGGDLRVFGTAAWPITIRGSDQRIALERGALATSQYRAGRSLFRQDALIAPRRGVHRVDRTITVAAPRCVIADALTKIIALSGDATHPLLRMLGGQAWLQ